MSGSSDGEKGIKNDMNLVEMLREKSEETDMNEYLKPSLGGYTKQSVLEYLAVLKKNQQTMSETFRKNQQSLYEEKEKLKKSSENLANRLSKREAEYQYLSDAMKGQEIGDSQLTAADFLNLKNKIAALEEDKTSHKEDLYRLTQTIEQKENTLRIMAEEKEQLSKDADALKEMLRGDQAELKTLRISITELTNQLEGERDETRYWKGLQSEGKQAELTSHVNDLTEQLSVQTAMLEKANSDRTVREELITRLQEEVDALKANEGSSQHIIENLSLQNEKFLKSNEALAARMEEDYQKTMSLIREKSEAIVDKLVATKKLQEAQDRISMLELQLEKQSKAEFMQGNKET